MSIRIVIAAHKEDEAEYLEGIERNSDIPDTDKEQEEREREERDKASPNVELNQEVVKPSRTMPA